MLANPAPSKVVPFNQERPLFLSLLSLSSMRPITTFLMLFFTLSTRSLSGFTSGARKISATAAAFSTSSSTTNSCENTTPGALIFLHGLGDTPAGWSSLQSVLPSLCPRLSKIKYVFPPAPTVSITINGGMEMPGWFDLYDWPIGVGSKDDLDGLEKAVRQIEDVVSKLNKEDGIPTSRIVLGGFSQGGAVALLAAYNENLRSSGADAYYAGCVGLSAWMTLPDSFSVSEMSSRGTPMFWGHGQYDDKVLFQQQSFGVEKLRSKGVQVMDEAYPMGHESHPEEMMALATFVDGVLFGEEEEKS